MQWSLSVVSDSCYPMGCSLPGSSVHGIFQAIVLEWVAISFSRGSSQPRDWTQVSHIVGRCFTIWATREVQYVCEKKWIIKKTSHKVNLIVRCFHWEFQHSILIISFLFFLIKQKRTELSLWNTFWDQLTLARRDKKAFFSDQCKEIEENNRMGKTRDLVKKIRYTQGTFHAKMGLIKDRNGIHLTEAEDIKKRWQEYTEELYRKGLHDPENHNGVITHLEPDILECKVKRALGSITTN